MMAADYRHIGGRENRLGRHYSRFSPFWPTPALSGQSLALRKLCDAGSNRRSQAKALVFALIRGSSGAEGVFLNQNLPIRSASVLRDFNAYCLGTLSCYLFYFGHD